MKRRTPLTRHTQLRPVNPERRATRNAEQFGPFAAWIRSQPCVVGRDCYGPVAACHLRSRGAGGKAACNLFPACTAHHTYQHNAGLNAFERRYGLDLTEITERLWRAYQETP